MADARFHLLPGEIIKRSLGYVDLRDLLAVRLTCRWLCDLIAGSVRLQYHIALSATGTCEGNPGDPSITTAERLERVKAYEAAWIDCNLTDPSLPNFASYESHVANYVSGNFWIVVDSQQSDIKGKIHVYHIYQMPSPLCGVEFRAWELNFDFPIHFACVDSTQDLLVLTSGMPWQTDAAVDNDDTAHILSLSTGKPHPECTSWSGERKIHSYYNAMAICGDYVAMSVVRLTHEEGRQGCLSILNCKIGTVAAMSMLRHARRPTYEIPGFGFLDESQGPFQGSDIIYKCMPSMRPWHQRTASERFLCAANSSYLLWSTTSRILSSFLPVATARHRIPRNLESSTHLETY